MSAKGREADDKSFGVELRGGCPGGRKQTPIPKERANVMSRPAIGGAIGLGIAIPTLFLAVSAAGYGHGSTSLLNLFFPFTMLFANWSGLDDPTFLLPLAAIQFPLYGVVVGKASVRGRSYLLLLLVVLGALHSVAAIICMSTIR